jgi:hypothetical protein
VILTLQLKQHTLAGSDLRTSLTHSLERPWDFLLVAARHAVGKHVHVISALEQVQGGLQHAYMRLGGDFSAEANNSRRKMGLAWIYYLDAHENEGLEVMTADQRDEFGRGHREERLFDGGEAQWAKRRKVNAVIGLSEAYGRVI